MREDVRLQMIEHLRHMAHVCETGGPMAFAMSPVRARSIADALAVDVYKIQALLDRIVELQEREKALTRELVSRT
jgi:hypothetical protein